MLISLKKMLCVCVLFFYIAIMSRRSKRIRPADEARSYVLSSGDKPVFVERFIDSNKGMGQHITCAFLITSHLHTLT